VQGECVHPRVLGRAGDRRHEVARVERVAQLPARIGKAAHARHALDAEEAAGQAPLVDPLAADPLLLEPADRVHLGAHLLVHGQHAQAAPVVEGRVLSGALACAVEDLGERIQVVDGRVLDERVERVRERGDPPLDFNRSVLLRDLRRHL
jgi:hypothetical protein